MNHFLCVLSVGLLLVQSATGRAMDAAQETESRPQAYMQILQKALEKTNRLEWSEAAPLWGQLVERNPTMGSHWLALAMAQFYQGHSAEAIAAFTRAREMGSFPDYRLMEVAFSLPPNVLQDFAVAAWPWGTEYFIACCYARNGEKANAMEWLRRALKSGLRDRFGLKSDPRLASLHQDADFKRLLAIPETKGMPREEGWRTDIRLLGEEITRLHYAANRQAVEPTLKKQIASLIAAVPRLSDTQIAVRIMQLLTLLRSGHTTLPWWDSRSRLGSDVPATFYLFQEGMFITSATPAYRDLVGARVVQVGSYPIAQVLETLATCISHDNSQWIAHIAPLLLRKPGLLNGLKLIASADTLPLTVELRSGQQQQITLPVIQGEPPAADTWLTVTGLQQKPQPLYLREAGPYWYEYLPESHTLYVQYASVSYDPKDPFDAFCKRLFAFVNTHEVRKLVVDLRRNSGGNSFLLAPLVTGLVGCDRVNQRGKLFVIVGRATFSAAMNCATLLERHTQATFVGEPTGSSPNFVGETVLVTLPYSKVTVSLSDLYWQSSWPMDHRTSIPPLLYAPPTFAAYQEGRDPALETVLTYTPE